MAATWYNPPACALQENEMDSRALYLEEKKYKNGEYIKLWNQAHWHFIMSKTNYHILKLTYPDKPHLPLSQAHHKPSPSFYIIHGCKSKEIIKGINHPSHEAKPQTTP